MRIVLSSFLLLSIINIILARSIYSNHRDAMGINWWDDYDYNLYGIPTNQHYGAFSALDEVRNNQNEFVGLDWMTPLIDAFLDEDNTDSGFENSHKISGNIDDKNNNDIDNDKEDNDNDNNNNNDEANNHFEILFYIPSTNIETDIEVTKSSEEKTDSEEKEVTKILQEIFDLEKSSEEQKTGDEVDASHKSIDDLDALIITLIDADNLHENPQYTDEDDENDKNNVTTSKNGSDEENDNNDDNVTTPKDDNTSNENESEDISIVFQGINDDATDQQQNLNKYEIVTTSASQEFSPTTSPYTTEVSSSSSNIAFDFDCFLMPYIKFRSDMDFERETMKNYLDILDEDFFNKQSFMKFKEDLQEIMNKVDRIQRNIKELTNLTSICKKKNVPKVFQYNSQEEI